MINWWLDKQASTKPGSTKHTFQTLIGCRAKPCLLMIVCECVIHSWNCGIGRSIRVICSKFLQLFEKPNKCFSGGGLFFKVYKDGKITTSVSRLFCYIDHAVRERFLIIKQNQVSCNLYLLLLALISVVMENHFCPSFPWHSFMFLKMDIMSSLNLLFSRLNLPSFFSLSL